jgi:tripartite-type tricarboxylate transporter receptor subunit TctC
VPGYEANAWYGIGAPKSTQGEIIDKLNRETNAILSDPKTAAQFVELGIAVAPGSPTDFGKFIAADTQKWAKVVTATGAKAD